MADGTAELHLFIGIMILAAAAVSDLKFWRIGNNLLLAGVICATIAHIAESPGIEPSPLMAGILLEVLLLWLFARRMTGAGDVKLSGLILYILPNRHGLKTLLYGFLFAGVFAAWKLSQKGVLSARIRHAREYHAARSAGEDQGYYRRERDGTDAALPMAVFMFAAVCTVAAASGIRLPKGPSY